MRYLFSPAKKTVDPCPQSCYIEPHCFCPWHDRAVSKPPDAILQPDGEWARVNEKRESYVAKKSMVARNNKRAKMAENQKVKRAELREKLKDPNLGFEEKQDVMFKLQSLPRNGAKVRVLNRCQISGRPKAVYRKFKVSRIVLRELAHKGMVPGMRKASW